MMKPGKLDDGRHLMGNGQQGLEIVAVDTDQMRVVGQTAAIDTRIDFAGSHLFAAAKFSQLAEDLEINNVGGFSSEPFFREIMSYVSASQITAAAALESFINELFIDRSAYFPEYTASGTERLWEELRRLIERRDRVLDKYDRALALKDKKPFAKDKQSPDYHHYRTACLLIDVRNELVHFKPQWASETRTHAPIAQQLLKVPVAVSPFRTTSPATFPTDFMSHDMARWAVKTAWNFIEAFSQRARLPNKYAFMVNDINPGYPIWPVP